jgi:multiple sugar transport system substrate-binding protein
VIAPVKGDFSPAVLAAQTVEGKVYGIPQAIDTQVLFYRKSLLQAAGVQPPQTVDELIDAAAKLSKDGVKGFFAGNDGGVGVLSQMLIWAAGQEMINPEKTGIGFDNDAGYTALATFAELHASGGVLDSASADWFASAPLVNGETAMQWTGLWVLPEVQSALGDDFGPWRRDQHRGQPARLDDQPHLVGVGVRAHPLRAEP